MLGRAAALGALGLILTGCVRPDVVVQDPPRLEVSCPDPAARMRLGEGSTYRDLALSRSEAIAGWERCHGALGVSQKE
jgi:hypothetical protein